MVLIVFFLWVMVLECGYNLLSFGVNWKFCGDVVMDEWMLGGVIGEGVEDGGF